MVSEVLRARLEAEVVGQPRAVETTVRGVTMALAGAGTRRGPLCAYLFLGPPGTGKSHLVRTLASLLHPHGDGLVVADCTAPATSDPYVTFASQLLPAFAQPQGGSGLWQARPLTVLLVESFERARPPVVHMLASALETGVLPLPHGQPASLRGCLVFITTALCSREILEAGRSGIGFSPSPSEERSERARIFEVCHELAVRQWGADFMDRLDDVVVFHPLTEAHLEQILDRLVARVNAWLAPRSLSCMVLRAAREFLLERAARDLRRGARDLVRAHRRHLEFPLSDLVLSGRVPPGSLIVVDRRPEEDHLHFAVNPAQELRVPEIRTLDVSWEEPAAEPSQRSS